jgi:hypothetical protein
MQPPIPFAVQVAFGALPGSASLPAVEGYVLELHGLYLSVDPGTYSLTDGPCDLQVGGLQGLNAESTVTVDFVPSSSEEVNLHIPLRARALGNAPVTFEVNTGGGQSISMHVAAWGELVPLA